MTLGPSLYGVVIDLFPKYEEVNGKIQNTSRVGMYMLYWSSIFGVVFCFVALILILKKNKESIKD